MIKCNGPLTVGAITYSANTYLFVKLYLNGAGTTESEAIIYADQSCGTQLGAIRLPNYTADQLTGGVGVTDFDKMLNALQVLTITELIDSNPNTEFTIVEPTKPQPIEDVNY